MNAALSTHVDLTLTGDPELRRRLCVRLTAGGNLTVMLYAPARGNPLSGAALAYVSRELAECNLDCEGEYCLWVCHTAFEVTRSEAHEIHEALSPHGLRSNYVSP